MDAKPTGANPERPPEQSGGRFAPELILCLRTWPGATIVPFATWEQGWSVGHPLVACVTCGESTSQRRPDGVPDHHRHYGGRP